jgi:hypothetical protein
MPKIKPYLYVIAAIVLVSDFYVHHEHAEFVWETIPGFSAFYGFVSCVVIILATKVLGALLGRKGGYYE